MDAKLLNQLKAVEESLGDIEDVSVRTTFQFLLNCIDQLLTENQQLREENQQLRDENNRLKGEQGKPIIRPQAQDGDISSEKERSASKKPPLKKKPKKRR